jgi:ubiquinone/menaquinone biosynthesis C-methylase UbiE
VTPGEIKGQQRRAWEANADAWRRHWAVREALEPVTVALIELADIKEGQWVLDVATGLGEPALTVARRVGKEGKVVGIDLSPKMIAFAEERARAAGLRNVAFHVQDAEELAGAAEGSYDAALCRFGLVYLPELARALRGVHHVLTPRAPFASAVWAAPERVPFIQLAKETIHRVTGLPGPGPGMPHAFALAERGRLEQALSSAGFEQMRGERLTIVIQLASAAEYCEVMRDTTRLGALVDERAPEKRDEAWGALAEAAAVYADASGRLSFPCDALCVVGRRS